jgi:dTDP-4-dehydrorhamnose reductase
MLITGVSGLLGNNLAYYFKDKYEVLGLYNTHPVNIDGVYVERCELSNPDNIATVVDGFAPGIIIHCASLADVDECELDKSTTKTINVLATRHIVEAAQNYYGLSKYEGELEICKKQDSLIFRTNIFGWNIRQKQSIGEWILGELKAKRKVNGFKDAYFSSIYTMELARIIDISIQKNLTGIYNCGGINPCSKYEFALKIADCFGLDRTLITSVAIDEHDFEAKRGKDLSLNVKKLQKALHYRFPTIDQSIEAFYRDYKCGLPEEIKKNRLKAKEILSLIPYGRQWTDEKDIQAVVDVIRSRKITQGPTVEAFEEALSGYCGAKHAVAVNSGTSALHIACLAADLEEGDEVITSPITFVASANCAVYCGAKPVFADIDRRTYNISPQEIEKRITEKTRAVIPVHFAGQSCHMEIISHESRRKVWAKDIYYRRCESCSWI